MYLKELSKKAAIYERLASALGMQHCWVGRGPNGHVVRLMYLKELSKKAAIYERLASALGMQRCWVGRGPNGHVVRLISPNLVAFCGPLRKSG